MSDEGAGCRVEVGDSFKSTFHSGIVLLSRVQLHPDGWKLNEFPFKSERSAPDQQTSTETHPNGEQPA